VSNGKKHRVAVIGGGAAGMMAAISASRHGADVIILERNSRIGKKILVTGNGRCNYTNIHAGDVKYYHGQNPKFVYSALSQFNVEQTIDFFEKLGVAHKVEDMGKVFPMSDQASSVLDVMRYELEQTGVKIICDAFVKEIERVGNKFRISTEQGMAVSVDRAIITTGGKAKPSTGSDGSGYDLAKKFGHAIVDVFPGLVQLKLEGNFFNQIKGVKTNGSVELLSGNKMLGKESGDILFADYGVSGPPVFQLSRKAAELLHEGKEALLKISIIDSMNVDELDQMLAKRFKYAPQKTIEFSLVGLINKRLIYVILKEAGIEDLRSPVANISVQERRRIASILTDWRFVIIGTKSWPSAQITAGGVDTREINQKTMESKKVKGLFFAGEIIDIDGDCGGFNLQWAWSSGYVAGMNAAL